MKNPGVFQKNGKSPLSPPCLSQNERFPIPFLQISEKTGAFYPFPQCIGLQSYNKSYNKSCELPKHSQNIIKVHLAFIPTWPSTHSAFIPLGFHSYSAFIPLGLRPLGLRSSWPSGAWPLAAWPSAAWPSVAWPSAAWPRIAAPQIHYKSPHNQP